MSKGLKVALILLAGSILLCGVIGGGVVLWFNANKETLKADGDKAKREGEEYGRANGAEACVTEALRRLDGDRGIVAQALNNIFLQHCLEVAERPAGFCEGVPAKGNIIDSATWAVSECDERGHSGDQDCGRMMQVLQKVCGGK